MVLRCLFAVALIFLVHCYILVTQVINDQPKLAKKAKALNLDAIHDTVHEMAKDEARHGKAFEGLLKRYFG